MENVKEVMICMTDALRKMGDACDNYENEDYETAYKQAVTSAMNAVHALNMFVNDYPYGVRAFNESKRIFAELENLRELYETYIDDDELI